MTGAATYYQAALDLAVPAGQLPTGFPLARVGLIHPPPGAGTGVDRVV